MRYLELDDILRIHDFVIHQYGGSANLRDLGLLESALAAPRQTMFGKDLYPDLASKAAILIYSLVKNHSFVDGNKRTGLLCLLRFLQVNGYTLDATHDELYQFTMDVAASVLGKDQIPEWIRDRVRQIQARSL